MTRHETSGGGFASSTPRVHSPHTVVFALGIRGSARAGHHQAAVPADGHAQHRGRVALERGAAEPGAQVPHTAGQHEGKARSWVNAAASSRRTNDS